MTQTKGRIEVKVEGLDKDIQDIEDCICESIALLNALDNRIMEHPYIDVKGSLDLSKHVMEIEGRMDIVSGILREMKEKRESQKSFSEHVIEMLLTN